MTTGKQQMAEQSNSSDDLIAELSRLMAQDAHGSRQDAAPPRDNAQRQDPVPRLTPVASAPGDAPAAPFAVRIPGASANAAPPPPRFEFARPVAPVATVPRQEPSLAPAPAASQPAPAAPAQANAVTTSADDAAPFSFDFDFGQQRQQPEPRPTPVAPPAAAAPQPAPASDAGDHDTIADLIAAELLGNAAARPAPVAAAPVAAPVAPVSDMRAEPTVAALQTGSNETVQPAGWAPKPVAVNLADRPAQARPTLRPVNLTPVQKVEKPENDSFRVPPVFGLGTNAPPAGSVAPTPVAPEPVAIVKPRAEHGYLSPVPTEPVMAPPANDLEGELDPIDEIESLIGRAVRVELDNNRTAQPQPTERPVASPALRSLATPTAAPAPQARQHQVSSADEAILAAAAATGAEVGWVEPNEHRQTMTADEPRRDRAPRRAGLLRAFAGPLVAVALLLAAGFGLYSVLGLGGTDGPAPVLVADSTPTKSVPDAKSPVQQLQQSIVFNEMDGVVPGAEEQLVSRDQADVNEVTAIPPAAVTDEGLANRKVRTVTVRPDGTIVSGEDSVAGAAILPVDRPNVPAVPGAATASTELLASANATTATPTTSATTAPVTPAPAASAPVAALVPGTEIAVVDAAGAPVAGKSAPVPYVRPASVGDAPPTGPVNAIVDTPQASLPTDAGTLPTAAPAQDLTATAAPAQQAPVATAAPTNAPAYAQLSSQRSPEVAQQVARDLSAKYASILNGAQLEITKADLGARGIYYRVRVPAASREYAAQFCATVVANGGDCVAM